MARFLGTEYAKGPRNNVIKPDAEQSSNKTTRKNSPKVKLLFPGTAYLKQPEIEGKHGSKI